MDATCSTLSMGPALGDIDDCVQQVGPFGGDDTYPALLMYLEGGGRFLPCVTFAVFEEPGRVDLHTPQGQDA